ncbi:glycoside hydrolase [Apodospora peruviana]|uniref:Glycoside hydrolase n=1 Tax=Apodospora peruviana TaxID=516989 RepID=A0AAE0HT38_9PEZI|nr:glycoside hydrolase [Apodospora peruviana]
MVPAQIGGHAARAAFLMSSHFVVDRAAQASYAANTLDGARALQSWYYKDSTGLWDTTGWWNSANCLTVLADWAMLAQNDASALHIPDVMSNTFSKAQLTSVTAQKTISSNGLPISTYTFLANHKRSNLGVRGFSGFINEFYDDEGWWALAWIRSWDVTRKAEYLDMAEHIFDDMKNGTDNTCGGGIWWSKQRDYKNAIANELYLSVAASLANRVTGKKDYYLDIAKKEWQWFRGSGMINSNHLINDGLTIKDDGSCVNNGDQTWSYNQGVVLGGLVELSKATGDKSYLSQAVDIATAAIKALSGANGVIHEIDSCEPNCGDDGSQFKGIFVRNLHYLQDLVQRDDIRQTIRVNADSIWAHDRDDQNRLGVNWMGPASAGKGPTAGTHSSALDVLVAAMSVK